MKLAYLDLLGKPFARHRQHPRSNDKGHFNGNSDGRHRFSGVAFHRRARHAAGRVAVCMVQPPGPGSLHRAHRGAVLASTGDPVGAVRAALGSQNGQQAAVGAALGFATGYAARRVGEALLLLVGVQTAAVHLMAQRGWVVVDWDAIANDLSPAVRSGTVDRVVEAMQRKLPFGAAFSAACYAGMRWR